MSYCIGRLFEITGLKDLCMLMKERRSNNMQSKEDFIEMRVPASTISKHASLIRLTLSGVFSRAGATYDEYPRCQDCS